MSVAVRTEPAGDKGLRRGTLGLISNVVIGVASTAPAYSLAATIGLIAAAVGFQTPAIMVLAFIPMLLVSVAYYYLNRADPDCGTCFWWVTRAIGPRTGWMTGWAIIVADVVVMAALAQIAGQYTFLLFGADGLAGSTFWVTVVGVVWIVTMTAICTAGIQLSARTQVILLTAELLALGLFAVMALAKVYGSSPEGSVRPSWSWVNPFAISSTSAMTAGLLLGVFIYWGWDSTVVVNEETRDSARTPGRGAVLSTLVLLGTFVGVSVAAQAFRGPTLSSRDPTTSSEPWATPSWGHPWTSSSSWRCSPRRRRRRSPPSCRRRGRRCPCRGTGPFPPASAR